MSKERFEVFGNIIKDNEQMPNLLDNYQATIRLNEFTQRIAELEEQLKNKPKFNVGDKVYLINKDEEVERDFIESIDIDTFGIEYYTEMHSICWDENQLFATKEEAEAKLKKVKV